MPPSYRQVNFRLRLAKAVERRMIVDACARMSAFSNLLGFRYIGFGSPFFNDFALFHRRHGITNLICIERERQDEDRFLFNKPFDCIDMEWGDSNHVLPTLQWTGVPTIAWMDYDDPINTNILADIGTIIEQIEPGSVALFTIQAWAGHFGKDEETALDALLATLGEYVPADANARDMRGKAFQKMLRRVVDNEFARILNRRNAVVPDANKVLYKQIFNVIYSDGVRMTTLGGIFYRADQAQRVANCEFDDFDFIRDGDDPFEIRVPALTHKEQLKLNSNLPSAQKVPSFLSQRDVTQYRNFYRYYPTFIETDL